MPSAHHSQPCDSTVSRTEWPGPAIWFPGLLFGWQVCGRSGRRKRVEQHYYAVPPPSWNWWCHCFPGVVFEWQELQHSMGGTYESSPAVPQPWKSGREHQENLIFLATTNKDYFFINVGMLKLWDFVDICEILFLGIMPLYFILTQLHNI